MLLDLDYPEDAAAQVGEALWNRELTDLMFEVASTLLPESHVLER